MTCGACDLYPGSCPECRAAGGDSDRGIYADEERVARDEGDEPEVDR